MGRGTSGAVLAPEQCDPGSPADSDPRLVAAVRRGDDRAFEVLYHRYHRRIYAYVLGMVKDHGRAEDVTQEIFVSALRRMRETEQPLAFKPWLYQIAKNGCIDAFRRSKRTEEVSYDADEGLAPADHSRLVGTGPTPDAAVASKQDIEHLCGAFGGLSETHHEILVLRELEGLSYAEIGRRMGMSRPAVESTLFRARRRLTEEFDDIVSGARCLRIQGIIVTAVEAQLGTRDTRRLARHLAHCQGCRREALAAGLDRGLFARPTMRERVATKVAGFFPLPGLLGFRRGTDTPPPSGRGANFASHLPMFSDQLSGGWGKAVAGAAVLAAGVSAGVGVHHVASAPSAPPRTEQSATPPVTRTTTSIALPGPALAGDSAAAGTPVDAAGGRSGTQTSRRGARSDSSTAAERATSPGGGSAQSADASGSGSGSNVNGAGGLKLPVVTKDPTKETKKTLGGAVQETGSAVNGAVQNTTGAVRETSDGATRTVDETVGGLTGGGPVAGAVDEATDAVDETVHGLTGAVDDAVGDVTEGLGGLTGSGG